MSLLMRRSFRRGTTAGSGTRGVNSSTGYRRASSSGCYRAMNARSGSSGGSLGTKSGPGGSLRMKSGTGASWGANALESFIPTCSLAIMVPIIKILVIVPTHLVSAPFRMLALKIIPVLRMCLIPPIPPRRIPVIGSDDIDLRI